MLRNDISYLKADGMVGYNGCGAKDGHEEIMVTLPRPLSLLLDRSIAKYQIRAMATCVLQA